LLGAILDALHCPYQLGLGPLTETKAGYKWILSITDAFTNYVTFVPLPNNERKRKK
jgi:hypothetical protein